MSQQNITRQNERDRAREAAEALAALERRAAELGVSPFDPDEWLAATEGEEQTPEDVTREVDEFLSMLRELRDTSSTRSAG